MFNRVIIAKYIIVRIPGEFRSIKSHVYNMCFAYYLETSGCYRSVPYSHNQDCGDLLKNLLQK